MLQTVEDVVQAIGGMAGARRLTGAKPPTVSSWKARGQIPGKHYLVFKQALRKARKRAAPTVFGIKEP